MSRLSRTFPQRHTPAPDILNHAHAPAYKPYDSEALAELLFLGTLGHTCYATGEHWAQETVVLCQNMAEKDPLFLAQAAVMARTEGYVRSAPLVALMVLLSSRPRAQELGRRIFDRIVRTGDDLRNLVGLAQSGQFRSGYGGIVRRLVATWLNTHLDAYQAIKYAATSDRLSLKNILRLTHPAPSSQQQDAIFRWLVTGKINPTQTPEPIIALESLSHGEIDPLLAITSYNLPFEAVMPRVSHGDSAVWTALLQHAPYMFLLRSLRAMGQAKVWDNPANVEEAIRILTNPRRIAKAMQFPFRYYIAAQSLYDQVPQALTNAIYEALEISLANVPDFGPIQIAVACDVSGSMSGTMINRHTSAATIAALFTAAIWKTKPDAAILPFGTDVLPVAGNGRDSLVTLAQLIGQLQGGGTDLSAPLRKLYQSRKAVDLFIGLTDSEDWSASGGWYYRGNFPEAWHNYKQFAPEARAVLIQLAPSGTRVVSPQEEDVHYVYGWSDRVLHYVAYVIQSQTMTDKIRATPL